MQSTRLHVHGNRCFRILCSIFSSFVTCVFKALLFLGAGCVIHSMSDEQNIKKMGGLFNKIPLTYFTMLIGSFSLLGLPFFSGYYSKDIIIELLYLSESKFSFIFS